MIINQIFFGITKQVHMISNDRYLNKAIKAEAVTAILIVSLMSQNSLLLTGFYFFLGLIFGKVVINW